METADSPPLTRRQRVRDATLRELISVSRNILTTQGAEALTIRAVAREMGMTAPAIYRYFGSHRDLMDAVKVTTLDELAEHITTELNRVDREDHAARLIIASRALRRWAIEHSREFQLSLIVTAPEEAEQDDTVGQARRQIGAIFGGIFADLWDEYDLPAIGLDGPTEQTRVLAERLRQRLAVPLPNTAAAVAFTRCWLRLYGIVCLESTGLTRAIGDEAGALFESELADLARLLRLPESALDADR